MTDPKDDAIDAAIASAAADQRTVTMVNVPVTIASTGRPAVISVPVDLTGNEVLELISWMAAPLGGLSSQLQKVRSPASRLILPQ